MFLKRLVIVACLWTFGFAAYAQSPSQQTKPPTASGASATPSADQILDHYIEAAGGRAAWQKLTSRVSMGTIEVPSMDLSGTVVIHEKAPDKILMIIIIAGSAFRQGFDGTVGWTDDPQDGLHEQTGAELAETRRQADFYGPLDLRKQYAKFTVVGEEQVGGRASYSVQAMPSEGGEPDTFYFDVQTGLPIRVIRQHYTLEGVSKSQSDLSDYRDVDGVKLPFRISQTDSDSAFAVRIDEIHHNVALDDSEFSKPAVQ